MPEYLKARGRHPLRDPAQLEAYLQRHLREGPAEFRVALRQAVLSQPGGIAGISRRTGLARSGLNKALSRTGNPSYGTVHQVLQALGMNTLIMQGKVRRTRRPTTMEQGIGPTQAGDEKHGSAAQKPSAQPLGKEPKTRILPGSGKGLFVMSDDFDAPLPEFGEYT